MSTGKRAYGVKCAGAIGVSAGRVYRRLNSIDVIYVLSELFLSRVDRRCVPRTDTIDKSSANTAAIESYDAEQDADVEIRQVKYINNIVEQDHRAIKTFFVRLQQRLGPHDRLWFRFICNYHFLLAEAFRQRALGIVLAYARSSGSRGRGARLSVTVHSQIGSLLWFLKAAVFYPCRESRRALPSFYFLEAHV